MTFKDCCLSYPSYEDFNFRYDEGASPHVFNYFCLHGSQVFIRRSRNFYEVFTRGFSPFRFKRHVRLANGQHHYTVVVTDDINYAMRTFSNVCRELLDSSVSIYVDSPPPF